MRESHPTSLLVAIIGAVAVVLAAVLAYNGGERAAIERTIQATETAKAHEQANAATPTPTELLPTPTATATPHPDTPVPPTLVLAPITPEPATPTPAIEEPDPVPAFIRATCNWEQDWQEQSDGTILWVGMQPGAGGCPYVGQKGELLQRLQNEKLTLIVNIGTTPMGLDICSGAYSATSVINGQTCKSNNPELWPKVSGTLIVQDSTGFLIGPAVSPASTVHTCIESPYQTLPKAWVSAPEWTPSQLGKTRVYSHCPPASTIQYEQIAVDDQLDKIEKACGQSIEDITTLFEPYQPLDDKLLHYRSVAIDLTPDCRIDFTVRDTLGENIGLMIKKSIPAP